MTRLFMPVKQVDSQNTLIDELDKLHLGSGFGKVPYYLLFDTETGKHEWVKNENHHFGGDIFPWDNAKAHAAEVIIAPSLGSRPYEELSNQGLKILQAGEEYNLNEVIEQFKANSLSALGEPEAGTCCSGSKHKH